MEYSGVNLPNTLTIIENKNGQGYVVPEGGDLTAAKRWADLSGSCQEHTFENGIFSLKIVNPANASSQGGKLSFWNCKIIAPKGKEFLIGVSSDSLCELIINNTFINGKCDEKIYLAKYKGNQVYALTENMPSYKLAIKDRWSKGVIMTSNYKPGDLIENLTSTSLYLGEIYEYLTVYKYNGWWSNGVKVGNINYDRLVVVKDKPEKYHWLVDAERLMKSKRIPEEKLDDKSLFFFVSDYLLKSKPKRKILKKSWASREYVDTVLEKVIKHSVFDTVLQKSTPDMYLAYHSTVYSRRGDLRAPNKDVIEELCAKYTKTIFNDIDFCVLHESELTDELREQITKKTIIKI